MGHKGRQSRLLVLCMPKLAAFEISTGLHQLNHYPSTTQGAFETVFIKYTKAKQAQRTKGGLHGKFSLDSGTTPSSIGFNKPGTTWLTTFHVFLSFRIYSVINPLKKLSFPEYISITKQI